MDETAQPYVRYKDRQGLELQEVSNAMVRIYKELLGRGPTKARTNYAGPDTLIATIENSLMPAERNMIALEEHQRVREIRISSMRSSRSRAARSTPSLAALTPRETCPARASTSSPSPPLGGGQTFRSTATSYVSTEVRRPSPSPGGFIEFST